MQYLNKNDRAVIIRLLNDDRCVLSLPTQAELAELIEAQQAQDRAIELENMKAAQSQLNRFRVIEDYDC